jgi:single-strand DNA-binding protein
MVNRAELIGRLGKDPEVRYTADGTMVASFSLATDESWKDKASGERKKRTDWHRISVFGRLAEICAEYLTKGSLIYLTGPIQTRSWEDKEGNKRSTTEIVGKEMKMLDGKKDGGGKTEAQGGGGSYPGAEDGIPF